ncbi:hypothetical protein A2803_02565 [Candidatus Woesebacteria bacterium RIFCSPHIGHO2_01_FULL_44_21]|uniref:Glycosyltransferase RgtA/B/C/D-like domain-containing protein n=1 Tax=Candidatus Woesebacteria bacterium RIFCSPHIGHO2_01_FULL_44_21 TaxID=1802503 RepID=A0A1F7YXE4_9BACT|nr:MAG: hypothetical protein A2803_02565 [Candidatus Woesebacteria bacterium RIFCSPHIGHO2_01_FULL_44_21]OGM69845.1 MAG: hypothetical protein A2897_00680 [Candidatus Woesebacteria bacterium RIFCSPLOWO2_01_FULL_44_24b]
MRNWKLVVVVLLAFLLRFVNLASYPAGFSADEVNQGYTAYSILKTGKDEWGEPFPVAPRSYGDYRAPLYTYLTVPSVGIFGLNEFATRLPAVIFGTLSVAVVYFLVRELFKEKGEKLAVIASSLLAISPWHVALSRGAFEPNLPTLIIPLGVLFFLKGRKQKNYMLAAALSLGLGLFSYYSFRLLFPGILFLLYICFRSNILRYKLPLVVLGLFTAIAIYTMFVGASSRLLDVSIAGESSWHAVSEARYNAVLMGLPDLLARVFNNKLTYLASLFTKNYLSYFSPQFLFTSGAGEATYGMAPGMGLMYPLELLFIAAALVHTIVGKLYKKTSIKLTFAMLIIAPIPAALATGPGMAANRAAVMLPWLTIISAIGIYAILKTFSKKYIAVSVLLYFIVSLVFFLESYYYHSPRDNARSMSYGWRQASEYIRNVYDSYDKIVVSGNFSEPQMFAAFFMEINPGVVQAQSLDWLRYESQGLKFVDQLGEYKLDKFVFKGIDKSVDTKTPNTLIMGRPEDFIGVTPDHVINYPDGEAAIYFVSSREVYAKEI